jgi:hypothetical protein
MLKNILMTVISIRHDTYLQLDTTVPTVDLTAFHRHDSLSLTQTDKKEKKICQRFAFLKISKKGLQHICLLPPLAAGLRPPQAKELQYC